MDFDFLKGAGLFSIYWGKSSYGEKYLLHLFVYPEQWLWGKETETYDFCSIDYGFGPLFLLCVMQD